jgi:hypothetical protein
MAMNESAHDRQATTRRRLIEPVEITPARGVSTGSTTRGLDGLPSE